MVLRGRGVIGLSVLAARAATGPSPIIWRSVPDPLRLVLGRREHARGLRSIAMNVSTGGQVRSAVLVHGAYADGSSWSEVIARLQAAGVTATAVQNPLGSLADDVAHTRRILAIQDGPTILAGHSFAGTVITEAGADPGVVGLVYVAARAPGRGRGLRRACEAVPDASSQRRAGIRARVWRADRGGVSQ